MFYDILVYFQHTLCFVLFIACTRFLQVSMLKNGSAITFHKKVCPDCHTVPKSKEWTNAKPKPGINVFHTGKRTGYHLHWEPIFIGTHNDPLYDERLSWEGKMDKMTQVLMHTYIHTILFVNVSCEGGWNQRI